MPLPAPTVDRKLMHTRTVTCQGFERADGLWDIDGWITDIKTYDVPNEDRGGVPAGVPMHGMGLRMTIDLQLNIHEMVAVQDFSPYRMCPSITPAFKKLVGLNLGKGFTKAMRERVGGTLGCVHLVDLLGPMATTAYQTLDEIRYKGFQEAERRGEPVMPFFVGACHAWARNSEVVKREFPTLYTGA
jgi:hypothetical protein